jgi:hypothetical protein
MRICAKSVNEDVIESKRNIETYEANIRTMNSKIEIINNSATNFHSHVAILDNKSDYTNDIIRKRYDIWNITSDC